LCVGRLQKIRLSMRCGLRCDCRTLRCGSGHDVVRTLRVIPASVFCSSVVASLAACLAESSLGAGVVGVRLRELVALWAVRLRGIGCSQCLPSHQVLAWCHHLKMGRIHAVMTTAQVIDLFTFGYFSTDK